VHGCKAKFTGRHRMRPDVYWERPGGNTPGGSTQNWSLRYKGLVHPADRAYQMHQGVGWFFLLMSRPVHWLRSGYCLIHILSARRLVKVRTMTRIEGLEVLRIKCR